LYHTKKETSNFDYTLASATALSRTIVGAEGKKRKKTRAEKKGNILACILGFVFFDCYFFDDCLVLAL
jgi:hypothetical protein